MIAPLRKITEVLRAADDAYGRQLVMLECGHRVAASAGAIYRARCRHCKAQATQTPLVSGDSEANKEKG